MQIDFENDQDIKNVNELIKSIGASKTFTISGFYPGSDGLFDYPISLEE